MTFESSSRINATKRWCRGGSLFHARGPAAAKNRSPSDDVVRGTATVYWINVNLLSNNNREQKKSFVQERKTIDFFHKNNSDYLLLRWREKLPFAASLHRMTPMLKFYNSRPAKNTSRSIKHSVQIESSHCHGVRRTERNV